MTRMYEVSKYDMECPMFKIYVGGVLVMVLPGEYVPKSLHIDGPADLAYDDIATMPEVEGYSMRLASLATDYTVYEEPGRDIPEDGTAKDVIMDIVHKFMYEK